MDFASFSFLGTQVKFSKERFDFQHPGLFDGDCLAQWLPYRFPDHWIQKGFQTLWRFLPMSRVRAFLKERKSLPGCFQRQPEKFSVNLGETTKHKRDVVIPSRKSQEKSLNPQKRFLVGWTKSFNFIQDFLSGDFKKLVFRIEPRDPFRHKIQFKVFQKLVSFT